MCHDCPECIRLWREYAKAATRHLRYRHQIEVAAVLGDHPAPGDLLQAAAGADTERHKVLDILRTHELNAHGTSAALTPGDLHSEPRA